MSSPTSELISSLVNNNINGIINNNKGWKIEGKYAKGVISLKKKRDFSHKGGFSLASMNHHNDYGSKNDGNVTSKDYLDPITGLSKSKGNRNSYTKSNENTALDDDRMNRASSSTISINDLRLPKYEMFLAGMLSSGRQLNAKDQLNLATFRKQNNITDDEHWRVVKTIGYSKGDFNALLDCSGDGDVDSEDNDTCKICFTEKINAVILPCGHLALCVDCGRNLLRISQENAKCPICRNAVSNITQIYKA